MKRLFFIITLIIFTTSSLFAQIHGFAKVGMNLSQYAKDDNAKVKIGYKIGGGVEYSFDEMWGMQTALYLSTKGSWNKYKNSNKETIKTSIQQMYLELPIMGVLKMEFTEETRVNFSLGPYFAYGINGTRKNKNQTIDKTTKDDPFKDWGFRRFDYGIGCNFAVEHLKYMFGVDTSFGLNKVKKENPWKNLCTTIWIGYRF